MTLLQENDFASAIPARVQPVPACPDAGVPAQTRPLTSATRDPRWSGSRSSSGTARGTAADGVLGCIGDTPLVRLHRYAGSDLELYAKLEAANPGGSAKDRPALQMLTSALRRGQLGHGSVVVESSSGNMGIGLAQACRYYGLQFICVVDPHAQPQNLQIMQALGATVVQVTQPADGSYLAARLQKVRQLLKQHPGSFWPNQYANRQNPMAHELGTIREIDEALGGKLDVLFVAASSTGTAQGCRDYLRQRGRRTTVVVVDAVGSVLFGGAPGTRLIPGLGAGREPELARSQSFDRIVRVTDLDCVVGCRRAAQREAMLVGGSAGGVLETVRSLQHEFSGQRCAAILHDSGTRYLNTIFDDEWVEKKLGVTASQVQHLVDSSARPLQSVRES